MWLLSYTQRYQEAEKKSMLLFYMDLNEEQIKYFALPAVQALLSHTLLSSAPLGLYLQWTDQTGGL